MRRTTLKQALLVVLTGGLAAIGLAADLAAAAFVWGPAYAWCLIFWRTPNPPPGHTLPDHRQNMPASTPPFR